MQTYINPLSVSPTKWSNKLKQFIGNLPTTCLSVFDHFVKLALKGYLRYKTITSQNVPSKAQHRLRIFYFVEKLCSVLKIFKFLYF